MFEQNKAIARSVVEDGFNQGDPAVLEACSSPAFVNHSLVPGLTPDVEGWKNLMFMYRTAFPDLHLQIEHLIAEGNLVVIHFTGSGTHLGDLMGNPPTGRKIAVPGIAILQIENGKILARWEVLDSMIMMAQLGLLPV
jgi:predicted ester cyclase